MTTLIDKELLDYFGNLKSEIKKIISESEKGSLEYLIHSQMGDIINREEEFLEYINSHKTRPVLSISHHGLPSVASLVPDLEKISELSKEKKSFIKIAGEFRKGMRGKNRGNDGHLYAPVSEDDWKKELENRSKEKLQSQIGFSVNETEDGKFELSLREDIHLQGYDKHSKEFPVLIREGTMKYHVVWNRLLGNVEQSFYVPNTSLILQGRSRGPPKKKFDDITRLYNFNKKDYQAYSQRIPWFWIGSWVPKNYSEFLKAGSDARVNIANNALELLSEVLGRNVSLSGINKKDFEAVLAFSTIPFKNAPQTTPKEEDLFKVNHNTGEIIESKIHTNFNLIYTGDNEEVGEMEYFLPRNAVLFRRGAYGGLYRDGYKFSLGGVRLNVLGSAIHDENQFMEIQNGLKKIKTKPKKNG